MSGSMSSGISKSMSSSMPTPSDAYLSPREIGLEESAPYRTVSRAAIMSLVLGLFALLGLIFPSLLVLAAAGIALALVGLRSIKRYPEEYSGAPVALLGLTLCVALLLGGSGLHAYEYATECPPGAERISFYDLNPENRNAPPVPPAGAIALDGKKVFIKGYVYPDGQSTNIKQFVMIPDLGTCCFGGQPKLTDMVLVTLRDPVRTVYNQRKRKLTGILKVEPALKPVDGVTGVYYQLDVETIQ